MKKEPLKDKLYTLVLIAALMAFTLSFSIAVPLVCRPFYYVQIEALDMPEQTGYTAEEIRDAFDEMMDFCMQGKPFGTGVMKWSESGRDHFADCAVLFRLDIHVLEISILVLAVCFILSRTSFHAVRFKRFGPSFWAGSILATGFVAVSLFAASDFDRAFVIFHHLFFPGKENWIFDPAQDEIIKVLPEVFFENCAILIVAILFVICAGMIIAGRRKKAKNGKKDKE